MLGWGIRLCSGDEEEKREAKGAWPCCRMGCCRGLCGMEEIRLDHRGWPAWPLAAVRGQPRRRAAVDKGVVAREEQGEMADQVGEFCRCAPGEEVGRPRRRSCAWGENSGKEGGSGVVRM